MSEQRWLLILVILVMAANALVGGYLWWTGHDADLTATIHRTSANDQEVPLRLVQVTGERVAFPLITKTGLVRFWNPGERIIAESRTDGTQYQTLATITQFSLASLVWALDGQRFAALTDTGKQTRWQVFDIRSQVWYPLAIHTVAVAFSPRGDEIVFLESDGADGRIAVAFAEGGAPKNILTTRLTNAQLTWSTQDHITLITTDGDGKTKSLYTLTLDGRLQRLLDPRHDLHVLWASDNSRALVSWFDEEDALRTSIISFTTKQEQELPVATLARKCGWQDPHTVVCAIPKTPLSAQGYGRALVYDTIAILRQQKDGQWSLFDQGIRQTLSVAELYTRDGTSVLRNAVDDSLWALRAW